MPAFNPLGIISTKTFPNPVSPKSKIKIVNSIHIAARYLKVSGLYVHTLSIHGSTPYMPALARAPITIGTAGVTQPGAIGSPNISGPALIREPATNETATASSKVSPSFIARGAAANAVAPLITMP